MHDILYENVPNEEETNLTASTNEHGEMASTFSHSYKSYKLF